MTTLLLIEDEAMLRANVVRALARLPGLEIVDAGSLEEALPLLDRNQPDIIVSDIDLPKRTGIEILGELAIRRMRIPVIFVTGYLRAYGAQIPRHQDIDVLEKPLAMEDLRAAIERRIRPQDSLRPSAPFGVPDYMQLAGMGRHSVVIEVSTRKGVVGSVVMVDGEAWSADDTQGGGTEALRRLAFVADGVVSCRSLTGTPAARNLDASWEWVLMEAARSHDESGESPSIEIPPVGMPIPASSSDSGVHSIDGYGLGSAEREPADDYAGRAFERAWDEGISALLKKDHSAALAAFVTAREFKPDDVKVRANIDRLVQMGVGLPRKPVESIPPAETMPIAAGGEVAE